MLEIFDKDLPIKIFTDASIEGMGAILKQVQQNGEEKPVAYFSRKLNETQKRKKAIYLECLAIKEAVKYWEYWLIRRKFEVYADHKPLENLNIKARTDEELGDWDITYPHLISILNTYQVNSILKQTVLVGTQYWNQ